MGGIFGKKKKGDKSANGATKAAADPVADNGSNKAPDTEDGATTKGQGDAGAKKPRSGKAKQAGGGGAGKKKKDPVASELSDDDTIDLADAIVSAQKKARLVFLVLAQSELSMARAFSTRFFRCAARRFCEIVALFVSSNFSGAYS